VAFAGVGMFAARRISMDLAARPRLKQGIELTLAIQAVGCIIIALTLLLRRIG
jgi:hypothetical protein